MKDDEALNFETYFVLAAPKATRNRVILNVTKTHLYNISIVHIESNVIIINSTSSSEYWV
jgi:hypothetical protein